MDINAKGAIASVRTEGPLKPKGLLEAPISTPWVIEKLERQHRIHVADFNIAGKRL